MYDSMIFYRSFYEAISKLEPSLQLEIYNAIFDYGLCEEELALSPMACAIFELIKPQIDANNRRRENGKKGAEYGKLGGRPKKENPEITPRKPQGNPTETPNVNYNVNVNVNENENLNENLNENVNENEKEEAEKKLSSDFLDLYNLYCPSLPSVKKLTDKRKRAIRTLIKAFSWEEIKEGLQKAEASDFCKGNNDRHWKADIDFLTNQNSFTKLLEGKYDNRQNAPKESSVWSRWENA